MDFQAPEPPDEAKMMPFASFPFRRRSAYFPWATVTSAGRSRRSEII